MKYINPQKEFERLIPIAIEKACFSVEVPLEKIEEYREKITLITEGALRYKNNYAVDYTHLDERMTNGFLGQAALEHYLGVKITGDDMSKPDSSPDMKLCGLNIGIKVSKAAQKNAPLIPDIVKHPEIIMLIDSKNKYLYHCLGIFSHKILQNPEFRCKSLVKDEKAEERKTGFYRIDVGLGFTTFKDLKQKVSPYWLI
jgi:hypothetical protein